MTLPSSFEGRLSLPLIAAPMFLASGPELVIACCKAGIVGTFPAKNQRTLEGLEEWLEEITSALAKLEADTGKKPAPFGVNLIVHKTNKILKEELELCARYKVPLIITSLGAVPDLVEAVHAYGGIVFHDVINLRHAQKAKEAGVDGIIAVSAGAGGHSGQASPFGLVGEIRQIFDGCIILSGALSTGRDIAAATMMGADFAYMGTRFINTAECMASHGYKEMISKAQMGDILLTDKVTGINANFIRQSLEQAGMNPDELAPHGDMDIDKELREAHDPKQNSAKPWRDLWSAGHGVGQITSSPPVAELVQQLKAEFHAASAAQLEDSQKYLQEEFQKER